MQKHHRSFYGVSDGFTVRRGYCVWQNRNRLFLLQFNLLENAIGVVNLQLRFCVKRRQF
jgi:hypothetical protein